MVLPTDPKPIAWKSTELKSSYQPVPAPVRSGLVHQLEVVAPQPEPEPEPKPAPEPEPELPELTEPPKKRRRKPNIDIE